MSAKRTGLGRNLSALLQPAEGATESMIANQAASTSTNALSELPIDCLQPGAFQPRGHMDEAGLKALAESIAQQGVLQPIVVRPLKGRALHYEIIAGERRWRASQLAKRTHVPVVVRAVSDETAMALGLIENLQREALNVMDEARAMYRLNQEFGLTHQEIAKLLSKSRTAVSNCLRLLQLSGAVATLLEAGELDMGHARCLLGLSKDEQSRVADMVIRRKLSVRETEAWVAKLKTTAQPSTPKAWPLQDGFQQALAQLSRYLGTDVRLKAREAGSGRLWIDFKDEAELQTLLARLGE